MVMLGLVSAKSAADLDKEDKQQEERFRRIEVERLRNFEPTRLASHIKNAWQINKNSRLEMDDRLLSCLRARKGEYSPYELGRIAQYGGTDPVYLKLTGTKCRAASAWIRDILIPASDRAWKIQPTEEPELPEAAQQVILQSAQQQMIQMAQEGVQLSPEEIEGFLSNIRERVVMEMKKVANKAAKNVENKIQDLMEQGDWIQSFEELIEDFVTYPTAFLKGPFYKKKRVLQWVGGVATPKEDVVMSWRRLSPFDIYLEPYAKNTQEGDLIERLRLTPDSLYSMIGLEGYSEKDIKLALEDYKEGLTVDWIWTEYEKEQILNKNAFYITKPNTIDALHFWGKVRGEDLVEWGVPDAQISDHLAYYEVDAILIGNYVIRCVINDNPMGQRPYHYACWDAVPGSIWGIALPEQMEDNQKIVNACARSLMENMAIASGPQAVVLVDLLAEGEDITDIFPRKIWQGRSSLTGATGKPVDFFQPDMNAAPLMAVLNEFEKKADDVTNVPRYSYGNEKVGGAGTTASGLSMLLNSAAKGIRRAISNIDANIVKPTVYQVFLDVMMSDPDPALKGDCKIVPKGSAALLIKDSLQNQRKEFLALISNPLDAEIIGPEARIEILREFSKELGLDGDILPTAEEVKQKMASRIPPEIQEMQQNLQKAQQKLQQDQQKMAGQMEQIGQQALAVEKDGVMLEAEKGKYLNQLERDKMEVEQAKNENELEQDRLDVQKETLTALEKSLRAEANQKEAELERRLAQAERRVTKADIELIAAQVREVIAKNDVSKASAEATEAESAKEEKVVSDEQLKTFVTDAINTLTDASKAVRKITVEKDNVGKITGATNSVDSL